MSVGRPLTRPGVAAVCGRAVYDVSRKESFDHVTAWLAELEVYATFPNLVKMLVANKIDLVRAPF